MPLQEDYKKEEIIKGVVYAMSPSLGLDHANVNSNIHGCLFSQLKDFLCRVYMENADLYMDKSDAEYVIPDIMLVHDIEAEDFNGNEEIFLRELPNVHMTLDDIFWGIG